MKRLVVVCCCILLSSPAIAATITGKVFDPSEAGVSGARLVVTSRLGVLQETTSDPAGAFRLDVTGAGPDAQLVITAPGFARKSVALDPAADRPMAIQLAIAPVNDSITVSGSFIAAPLSEQGSSVTVIPRAEIEQRNEASALDLLRFVPGVIMSQTGQRGGVAALFLRGGEANFNLVLIDGVPVNEFRIGGYFDFAHVPTNFLDRIEVSRGAQSAVYGSYANSGVVNFISRLDEAAPQFNVIAEGGSHSLRRFALGAAGSMAGYRASAWVSRLDTDGEVANSDYRNENVSLNLGRRFRRQDVSFRGAFLATNNGVPGPYGSNPVGNFSGLDLVSRNQNNTSDYSLHYEADPSSRVRQELFGTFFLSNNSYRSRFGTSFNKDLRGTADARTTVSVSHWYTLAFGVAWWREQVKNTFITDLGSRIFPLRRDQEGIYLENRFRFGKRLYLNAGARAEIFETPTIPAGFGRPILPDHTMTRVNPKIAAGFALTSSTRAHASFGTGIRPPGGFDLAFTNNPALKPERTLSVDAGIEQQLGNHLAVDATYFYNRYSDLIVSLGGSLARLGSFKTDNLSNARARGAEFSARFRPSAAVSVIGAYTFLDTEILSLDGASGVAPQFYRVGQQLVRRPRHSGSIIASYTHRRISANLTAFARGEALDVEPNFGASAGFFRNPGFTDLGVNLNYYLGSGVTVYGNLRNALNRHYEEIYGYPSPRLNFVAGLKWRFSREP